jgi:hypothetical protein
MKGREVLSNTARPTPHTHTHTHRVYKQLQKHPINILAQDSA